MVARQNPFLHPSCLEAHATRRYDSDDCAPCNSPSIRQHRLTPATAPSPPAVPCLECKHTHETKEEKMQK